MTDRLYIVTNKQTGHIAIVEALSQSQAVHIISAELLEVHVATAIEVGKLMGEGAKIVSKNAAHP